MLPAQERLDADDGVARELVDWLVVQDELAAFERGNEIGFELEPAGGLLNERRRRSDASGRALLAWRDTSRRRRCAAAWRDRRHRAERPSMVAIPMLDGDHALATVDHDGLRDRVANSRRDGARLFDVVQTVADDDELVAADAGDRVGLALQPFQTPGDLDEHAVGELVAVAVVHELEVVEVAEQHGDDVASPRWHATTPSRAVPCSASRFGIPVSGSRRLRSSSSARSALWAVTSRALVTMPWTLGSSRRLISIVSNQCQSPARSCIRSSIGRSAGAPGV